MVNRLRIKASFDLALKRIDRVVQDLLSPVAVRPLQTFPGAAQDPRKLVHEIMDLVSGDQRPLALQSFKLGDLRLLVAQSLQRAAVHDRRICTF